MTSRLAVIAVAVLAVGFASACSLDEGVSPEAEEFDEQALSAEDTQALRVAAATDPGLTIVSRSEAAAGGCSPWASLRISGRCDTRASYQSRANSSCAYRYGHYYAVVDLDMFTDACLANNGIVGVYYHCCPYWGG